MASAVVCRPFRGSITSPMSLTVAPNHGKRPGHGSCGHRRVKFLHPFPGRIEVHVRPVCVLLVAAPVNVRPFSECQVSGKDKETA